jgi:hypothetical protein
MPGEGLNQPATDGVDYDNIALSDTDSTEVVVEGGTGSILLVAHPANSDIVYLGWDEQVSSSNGLPLEAGAGASFDIDVSTQPIYAIADSSGDRLRFIATN